MTPLVTAAREGAAQAARTHSRERARARPARPWWRRRWVMLTATGLAVVGAAGGAYAILATRNSTSSGTSGGGFRTTVEAGRDRVAGAARSAMDRIRRDNGGARQPERPLAASGPDNSRTSR